ncbi:MAG: cache domain-containing protein, partial [Syntrophobacteraceae bacterium]
MTLRSKTSLIIAVFIIVALGTSGTLYLEFLKDSLRHSILGGLGSISATSSEAITRFLDGSLRNAQGAALAFPTEAIEQRNTSVIEQKLKSLQEVFPEFENGMFLLDAEGELWVDYPPHPELRGNSYAYREYFQQTLARDRGIVGMPYVSTRINEPVLTFTAPLRNSSNEIIGVLGCSVRLLSAKTAEVIRSTRIGEFGYIFVFNKDRLMILHPDEGRVLKRDIPLGANHLLDASIIEGFEGVGETVNSRGVPMLASVSRISGTDWILMAQQPKYEAYAPIREATNRILFGMLIATIMTVFVSSLVVRRLTTPITKLREAAVRLKTSVGEMKSDEPRAALRFELSGTYPKDEIGDLASAFREMAEKLESTLSSLKRAAADWENTFNSVPDAVYLLDCNHRVLRINRSAASLFGVEPEEAVGQPCYRLVHKTEAPPSYCPCRGAALTAGELNAELSDSCNGRFFRIVTAPLLDKTGTVIGFVHVQRDITERKQVDETLK